MSARYEPSRWTDPASRSAPELASAVRAIRERHGNAAQLAALSARLQAELAAPTATGGAVLNATSVLSISRLVVLGVVCAAAAGALLYFAPRLRSTGPVDAPVAPTQAPRAPAVEAPRPSAQPEPHAAKKAPAPEPAATSKSAGHPPRAPATRARVGKQLDAEGELALLGRAQGVLDRDPKAALALTAEHARDYPRGVFAEEREVIALEAELKLGRDADARARAERFVGTFPRSAHVSRVRSLFGTLRGKPSTDNPGAEPTRTP